MSAYSTHEALVRTAVLLDGSDNKFLHNFGLNRTQYTALQLLDLQQGQRLVDLAAVLLCERSTVTRVIDHLEKLGLARRLADAADRRSQRVVLTPDGISQREKIKLLYEEWLRQRLSVLREEEQLQLVSLLQRLQRGLEVELPVITATSPP